MKSLLLCRITVIALTSWFCAQATGVAQEPGVNVWTAQDIGSPTTAGTSSANGNVSVTLTGQGTFGGTTDTGRFYYQPLTGDGSLVAKVNSISGAGSASANAGVMIRATTAAGAQEIYVNVTQSAGQNCVVRLTSSGTTTSTNVATNTIPYWVKVVRSGASFSGYTSPDGTTWTQIGSTVTMSLPDTVDIGLAAASAGSDVVTAAFYNVTLTQSNSLGNGIGMYGEFFNAANLTSRQLTRFDQTINFNWAGTTPAPAITSSAFSARWTGTITPRYTETYQFTAAFNGGVRVWVYALPIPAAGQATSPLIDSWGGSSGSVSGNVAMTVGTTYRIEVDYTTAAQANPSVSLSWLSPNQTSEFVPVTQLAPAYAGKGRVLDEKWLNVSGSLVSNLTSLTSYPNQPAGRHFLTSMNIGTNVGGDNYGDKMSGYIYPPETGNYTFYVAGSEEAQMWLSTSETPANVREICDVPAGDYTNGQQWTKYSSQKSASIYLYASQRYYFQVLHKHNTGGENCAARWVTPSGIDEWSIPGERVSPYEAITAIPTQTAMFNTLATGHPRLFTDAQGFTAIKADALTTSPAQSQRNIWYCGTGGTAATATTFGSPTNPSLLKVANDLFAQPPTEPVTGGAGDNGAVSYLASVSQILSRVNTLSMVYQLSGNPDYLNRAWEELDCLSGANVTPNTSLGDTWTGSATGWSTWGTNDLDFAEILNAYAVGYDWLYPGLSTAQISLMESQIVRGLNDQLTNYEAGPGNTTTGALYYGTGNHTEVNIGGVVMGALAIANDPTTPTADTTTAAQTMSYAMGAANSSGCLSILAPDGSDPESPDYHMFLTSYLGYALSSLEAANAGSMGIPQQPGQAKLGSYCLGIMGSVCMYQYNDCWDKGDIQFSPSNFWYGWKFDQSSDAWFETQDAPANGAVLPGSTPDKTVDAFDLLWYDSRGLSQNSGLPATPLNTGMALDNLYRTSDVMTFRSSYGSVYQSNPNDAYDLFAAIKGGDNTTGHAHLSQGSFVIQSGGYEWASLLGFDSYGLTEYFETDPAYANSSVNRWEYYRCRAEGSNTLVIGGNANDNGKQDQNCGVYNHITNSSAQSKVVKFSSTATQGETILNMTALYPNASQTLRGLQMDRPAGGTPYVLIQDEITTAANTSIYWFMHYQFEAFDWITTTVGSDPTTATQTSGSSKMFLKILSPPGATFYVTTASPLSGNPNPTGQNPNNAGSPAFTWWKKLAIHYTPTTAGTSTICVEIIPGTDPGTYPTVTPLKNW